MRRSFYTPFGVRCFGTSGGARFGAVVIGFLYALRREVLRNSPPSPEETDEDEVFLYALRREVLRNNVEQSDENDSEDEDPVSIRPSA